MCQLLGGLRDRMPTYASGALLRQHPVELWSVYHAVEVGKRVEPYHLCWLEDLVAHDDYAGLAQVADALTTPIAAGEYH